MNFLDNKKLIKIGSDDEMLERKTSNFVRNGKVYILGDFDETISRYVIPDLTDMVAEGVNRSDLVIPFYINSYGGEANELDGLMSMINMAKSTGITIVTYNIGVACSCGSLLACVGDKRFMYRGASNLMHLGSIATESKTYEQAKRNSVLTKDFFDNTVRTYVENSKMDEKEVRRVLADDMFWMNAKECKKRGLVDYIV